MNKSDLVSHIAEKAELTNTKSTEVLGSLLEAITDTMAKKDKLILIGFGTFETLARAARVGRNPSTGEEIKIKASIVPKFRAGKALKDVVAGRKSGGKNTKAKPGKSKTKKK